MVKAVVIGACGRMGKRIVNIIYETEDIGLSGGAEHKGHGLIGKDIGECAGIGTIGIKISSDIKDVIKDADVVIDFSSPQVSMESLREAVKQNKAAVIGTTGFSNKEKDEINELTKDIPCVLSPNMSIGINVMFKIVRDMAAVLGDAYDVEIIEAHHRFKKDAPSGTALKIAQVAADALKRNLDEVCTYTRKGIIGERSQEEIGIQTIRAGDIAGDHTVIFGGIGERLEITHRAQSRDTFARGAVFAAKWILGKTKGIYDMHDVLGIKQEIKIK